MIEEDIHPSLQDIFIEWDELCHDKNWSYDIVADEPNCQGFILLTKSAAQEAEEIIRKKVDSLGLHLEIDPKNRRGVLFTFTVKSINDGHWKLLPKKPRRTDLSLFANDEDAEKVRKKKTIFQIKLETKLEDQYKTPGRKMIRKQSSFPSSFGKSKSFGGIKDYKTKTEAIAGEMIPPQMDLSGNPGTSSAWKTPFPTKDQDPTIQTPRQDLTDLQTQIKENDPQTKVVAGAKVRWKSAHNPSFWGGYVQPGDTGKILDVRNIGGTTSVRVEWDKMIKSPRGNDIHQITPTDIRDLEIIEGTIPRTQIGRTNEKKTKQLGRTPVPDPTHEPAKDQEKVIEAQQHWGTFAGSWAQSTRGVARSGLQHRSQFGLPVQQAQDAEEATNGNIIKQLAQYPERAEIGFEFRLSDAGVPIRFKDKTKAIDYVNEHPAVTNAEYGIAENYEDEVNMEDISDVDPNVNPDDTVSRVAKEVDGPAQALAAQQNMRPLGLFGPTDLRAANAQPVTNVSVQHPPDRSFDANSPKVTVRGAPALKTIDDLYREFSALMGQG